MTTRTTRSEKLDLRLTAEAKRILATAAERRSLSDFVLESALGRAEETLADRRSFPLDAEKWAAFQAALDAPARDLPRLKHQCPPNRSSMSIRRSPTASWQPSKPRASSGCHGSRPRAAAFPGPSTSHRATRTTASTSSRSGCRRWPATMREGELRRGRAVRGAVADILLQQGRKRGVPFCAVADRAVGIVSAQRVPQPAFGEVA